MTTQEAHDRARRQHVRATFRAADDSEARPGGGGAGAIAWGCGAMAFWLVVAAVVFVVKGIGR